MDPRTDTDFILKLDQKVTEGFSGNQEEHQAIMDTLTLYNRRFDQAERAIQALQQLCQANQEGNLLLKELLLGSADGKHVGCQEVQRDHGAFLKTIKRLAWMVATPACGLFVVGIVAIVKHLLST